MSTNLSVIKTMCSIGPAEAGPEARRETQQTLIVILSTVALDAVGIGLIMPVLPGLLRDLVHSNDVTAHYGICWRCMR